MLLRAGQNESKSYLFYAKVILTTSLKSIINLGLKNLLERGLVPQQKSQMKFIFPPPSPNTYLLLPAGIINDIDVASILSLEHKTISGESMNIH